MTWTASFRYMASLTALTLVLAEARLTHVQVLRRELLTTRLRLKSSRQRKMPGVRR